MQVLSIKKNPYKIPYFKGRINYQKISETPPVPADKVVQFYGASSAIPTGLTSSYITSLQPDLESNTAIKNAIINEGNPHTKKLLEKTSPDHIIKTLMRMRDYALAREMSSVVAEEGYGILTGDASGAMEAAKKGAKLKGGYCVGVALKGEELIKEGLDELYVEDTWNKRLERFNKRAQAPFTIVMPGGEGSISKLWDKMVRNVLDARDGLKKSPCRIILVDKEYWQPMLDWLQKGPNERDYIRAFKLDMLRLVNNPEELRAVIKQIKASLK